MNATEISALAGILLSVLFSYLPGLSTWYEKQESKTKSLVMLASLVVVVAGAFGLSCVGWISAWTCTEAGVKQAVFAFVAALVANQGTFLITPKKST